MSGTTAHSGRECDDVAALGPSWGWLDRWGRTVARWRLVVVVVWILVVVVGSLAASLLAPLLTTSLALPGTSSQAADSVLADHFSASVEGTFLVVVHVRVASATVEREVSERLGRSARSVPTARVTNVQSGSGIVVVAIGTRLDLQRAALATSALRRAIARSGLHNALVTGPPALQADVTPVLSGDLRIGDAVAIALASVFLILMLGWTWAAAIPLAGAVATTAGALGAIYLLARHILMVLYVPNVVELIGFGLSVDYALLIVQRFREEASDPERPVPDAVAATMRTAGRTVLLSAAAVAMGLAVLLVIPVPFVRSLGVAGVVVPLVAALGSLTLIPALLTLLARRGLRTTRSQWWHGVYSWRRFAQFVLGHARLVLGVCAALLVVASIGALGLQLTPGTVTEVPANLPSARGLEVLSEDLGPGVATPVEIVVDAGVRGRARTGPYASATLRMADRVLDDSEVFAVAIGSRWPYVDPTGRYSRIFVVGDDAFGAKATQSLVGRLATDVTASHFPKGARVWIGGAPALGVDFLDRVYGAFPWVAGMILLLALALLARAFRSLPLGVLCVVLDLATMAATFGILVVLFRFGVGHDVLGLYRAPQLDGWVPVFLFAALFGLSMDYQVFLVSRMREARDLGAPSAEAIEVGLASTGRVVTGAAVIFLGALGGLVFGRVGGLEELGVGLAVGVAIDATIVRLGLLPSAMALCGEWIWWPSPPSSRRGATPSLTP